MLKRKQRRLNGGKQNYWVDTVTGKEYNKKPKRKLRTDRKLMGMDWAGSIEYKTLYRELRNQVNIRKLGRPDVHATKLDVLVMLEARELARTRTAETGIVWEVDHIVPLRGATVSGLHCAENLQVIPKSLNISKGNRLEYAERYAWLAM